MYRVNLENSLLVDHISLPVLVVSKDKSYTVKIGSEIDDASMQEITVLKKEVQEWIDANIHGTYKLIQYEIHFEKEDEAIYFKTVWI